MLGVLRETFINLEKGKTFDFIGKAAGGGREYFAEISPIQQIQTQPLSLSHTHTLSLFCCFEGFFGGSPQEYFLRLMNQYVKTFKTSLSHYFVMLK